MSKYLRLKTEKTKNSYLIQRLQKPYKPVTKEDDPKVGLLQSLANAFSFGGGLVNGGLSKDAMSLLKQHFRFDYMGAAEYEWGAVPEAFAKLAEYRKKKDLVKLTIDPFVVKPPRTYSFLERPKKGTKKKKPETPKNKEIPVYIICSIDHIEHVVMLLSLLSKYDEDNIGIRDSIRFRRSAHSDDDDSFLCHGWIELDNGFMFFIDKTMFDGVADIYNLSEKENYPISSEDIDKYSKAADLIYKEAK